MFYKRLKEQLEVLILGPLRTIAMDKNPRHPWPVAIVVDGLDECEALQYERIIPETLQRRNGDGHLGRSDAMQATLLHARRRSNGDDQVEILDILLHAVRDPAFPFRIVVASRPERPFCSSSERS